MQLFYSPSGETSANATNLSAGTYTVTVTDNNGCSGTASAIITQPASLNISASTTTTLVCNGAATGSTSSISSGGLSPYTYSWSPSGGTGASATNLSAGTYTVTVKDNNGCSGTASVIINGVNVKPEIIGQNYICSDSLTTLSASDTSALISGSVTYLWSNSATTSTITVSSSGTYNVVVYNDGCIDSTSFNVIAVNPTISACCDTVIQLGNSTHLKASGDVGYKWTSSPTGVINCDTCSSVIVTPTVTTTYTVTGIDSLGCSIERIIVVTVEIPCIDLVVPNVFTPNYAGPSDLNNVFYIKTNTLDSWSVFIYDRWGKEVFKTTNQNQYWTGTTESSGQAPDGVYYYIINATCQGTNYKKDGYVQLIR